ncbi:hypothetical protein [Actinoplanes derwentensis]|nr:hypothetical protein [Actinoplanes derwentensis]
MLDAADFNPACSPPDHLFWEQRRTAHPEQPDFIVAVLPASAEDGL